MVAFFRSLMPAIHKQPDQQVQVLQKELTDNEDEDDNEVSKRSNRIRRQTPNNNRKRSKDSEEFGGWNPYAGRKEFGF